MSESRALVPAEPRPFEVSKMIMLAKMVAASGDYPSVKDANKAMTRMMIGHELGFGAGASLSGVIIVQGKPVLSASLMAALVKRSSRYDYRVAKLTNEECVLVFLDRGEKVGESSFTMKDAQAAGLMGKPGPWKQYPRNMLFARALSNGVKWFCPDLTAGSPIYTPDELGVQTDGEGDPIDVEVVQAPPPAGLDEVRELIAKTGTDEAKVLQHFKVCSLEEMGSEGVKQAKTMLEAKLKAMEVASGDPA